MTHIISPDDDEWCVVSERPPKVRVMINLIRMKLDVSEWIQREMSFGRYEPEQTAWFKKCLVPGDIVVDVGASFGYYTTLSRYLVGNIGKVFAFEPSPIANKTIEETIIDSKITNILLFKGACGDKKGNISLFLPGAGGGGHSPSVFPSDSRFVPIEVPVVRLDEFEPLVNQEKNIKLVKIDVEGYEPNVLDGMSELIKAGRVENIICEFNSGWLSQNVITPEMLFDKFINYGYKVVKKTGVSQGPTFWGGTYTLQDIWFTKSQ